MAPTHLLHTRAINLPQQRQDQRLLPCPRRPIEERVRAVARRHLRDWQGGVSGAAQGPPSQQPQCSRLLQCTAPHQLSEVLGYVLVQHKLVQRLGAVLQQPGEAGRGEGTVESTFAAPRPFRLLDQWFLPLTLSTISILRSSLFLAAFDQR